MPLEDQVSSLLDGDAQEVGDPRGAVVGDRLAPDVGGESWLGYAELGPSLLLRESSALPDGFELIPYG
jgi:hypothetical protein